MKNILLRALSGSIYVALIIFCILAGKGWFLFLSLLFITLGCVEIQNLLFPKNSFLPLIRILDIIAAFALIFVVTSLYNPADFYNSQTVVQLFLWLCVIALMYIPLRIVLAVLDRSETPFRNSLASFLSLAYVAAPFAILMAAYNGGHIFVLATFVFIWVNDTGAYLSGMTMGRHKLCERLSPKKTWEGFWGGFVLSMVAGLVISLIINDGNILLWIFFAALVSVFGTFGDLFESLIKRTVGVKDSGKLIPGHGGILDRIDSLLAVTPLTLLFAILLG